MSNPASSRLLDELASSTASKVASDTNVTRQRLLRHIQEALFPSHTATVDLWLFDPANDRLNRCHTSEARDQIGPRSRSAATIFADSALDELLRPEPLQAGHYHIGSLAIRCGREFLGALRYSSTDHNVIPDDCPGLGPTMAALISKSRLELRLEALKALSVHTAPKSPTALLQDAAKILVASTGASVCIIYGFDMSMRLRALTAAPETFCVDTHQLGPESLTGAWLNETDPLRIADLDRLAAAHAVDRSASADISRYLHNAAGCNSRLVLAVRDADTERPWLLVKLAGKSKCLTPQFSPNDAEILRDICTALRPMLAPVELNEFVRAYTRQISTLDQVTLPHLFPLLSDRIPGLTSLAYVVTDDSGRSIRQLGGESWFRRSDAIGATTHPVRHDRSGQYAMPIEIPGPVDQEAALWVLMRREYLRSVEERALSFAAQELGQMIRSVKAEQHHAETLAQIRHAVRASLMPIISNISILKGTMDIAEDGLASFLNLVSKGAPRRAIDRAHWHATRVGFLLDEANILLGHIQPRFTRVSISRLLKDACASIGYYAARRRIPLELHLPPIDEFDDVNLDPDLMLMLLFNVIENAIKYSNRMSPVDVSLSTSAEQWEVAVSDIGTHLDPDNKTIYEPFRRGQPRVGESPRPGTGIGLAAAQEIIIAHDGAISHNAVRVDGRQRSSKVTFNIVALRNPSSKHA